MSCTWHKDKSFRHEWRIYPFEMSNILWKLQSNNYKNTQQTHNDNVSMTISLSSNVQTFNKIAAGMH